MRVAVRQDAGVRDVVAARRLDRRTRRRGDVSPAYGPVTRGVVKRGFDLAAVVAALPVLLPTMGVIALLVRLDSPGPALFRQRRYGRGGRRFTMVKFRTMSAESHEALYDHLLANQQHAWEWANHQKLRADPRVTRVGRWLRRTSLDELPQVWNVLRGEMSLVGPRPLPVPEKKLYGRAFALYCQVRPGLTGRWQVSGRNDLPYDAKPRLDAEYVLTHTLWGDAKLLLRTVAALCSRRGAY